MNTKLREFLLATVEVHVKRLKYAIRRLEGKYPLNGDLVLHLDDDQLLLWELLSNRFAKLQDLLGNKIFNLYLDT